MADENIQAGQFVQLHYKGTFPDGEVFDSSEGKAPLTFTVGSGQIIPGFESALIGKKVGDLTNSLKRACVTEDGALLFVHASVDTTRPLTMQKDQFWWDNGNFNEIKNKFSDFSLFDAQSPCMFYDLSIL